MRKRIAVSVLLCLSLLLSSVTAFAAGEQRYLAIGSVKEFLSFAEDCRLDSYSLGLTVALKGDIDLTGTEFDGIPIFSGTFQGGGHTISGLSVTGDGSNRGLFRYLTETATVTNLTVEGTVKPGGSRSSVGGIAGSNAGRIKDCTFRGEVSGADSVGGIAGVNAVSGILENCRTEGMVHGTHFIGGLAGQNLGVIRACSNEAEINTTAEQNSVSVSDLTLETLSGSESAITATDIGGIAGGSSGVIRDCRNGGNVGYPHIGYNVGGIAGSQTGYLTGCRNEGTVHGRKEVGGIVGQMEPNSVFSYETDTIQILEGQVETLSGLAGQAGVNAHNNADLINQQMDTVEGELQTARDALDVMIPDNRHELWQLDRDTLVAAQNTLSSSLTNVSEQLRNMAKTTESAAQTLVRDLEAVMGQMNVIGETVGNASSALGGSINDVSDADTEDDTTGKVSDCVNYGAVQGDRNTGGIAGAASLENDYDPEDDLQITGDSSLNFSLNARAVLLRCENHGEITVKNENAGGIIGRQAMGLVRSCLNTGMISAGGGTAIGGIAGLSEGRIRESSANCAIKGAVSVGGIAGSGMIVTDCRSMVHLLGGSEQLGAVLGTAADPGDSEETAPVSGNYYLPVEGDCGGIDGISYAGAAEPMKKGEFLALPDLPEEFSVITLRFVQEDGSVTTLDMKPGGRLTAEQMPAIPEKPGCAAYWKGPDWLNPDQVAFDAVFEAVYTELQTVMQSAETDENGKPLALVQGLFAEGQTLSLRGIADAPFVREGETVLATQCFTLPESGEAMKLRYLLPETAYEAELRIMVRDGSGSWRDTGSAVDRSYAVLDVQPGDNALCLIRLPADYSLYWLIGGAAAVLMLVIAATLIIRRARRKK